MSRDRTRMKELETIEFKKQFFFTKKDYETNDNWKKFPLTDFTLYAQKDLEITEHENERFHCLLVGYMLDYVKTKATDLDLLQEVMTAPNIDALLLKLDPFCGAYILFCYDKQLQELYAVDDCAGLRECYYYNDPENGIMLASQPVLLKVLTPLEEDKSPLAQEFYNSRSFNKKRAFVTDRTNFIGVKRLKPNLYFNITQNKMTRFFPLGPMPKGDFEEVAQLSAKMIRGYLEAAKERMPLAIPISGGWDSRLLLAASRYFTDEVYYYVYKHKGYTDKNQDIWVPRKVMKKLGLPLDVLTYSTELPKEVYDELGKNFSFPRKTTFPFLFNCVKDKMQGYFTLNGNVSEVARMEFNDIKVTNPKRIASLQRYFHLGYAHEAYQEWLDENAEWFLKCGLRVQDMFYWEQDSANWTSKLNTEIRLFAENLQPFNSRGLLKAMLSLNKKYRVKQNPILHKRIIEILWPETLEVTVNPGFNKRVIKFLQVLGLYAFYREIQVTWKLWKTKNKPK